jgi:hypothetical protein
MKGFLEMNSTKKATVFLILIGGLAVSQASCSSGPDARPEAPVASTAAPAATPQLRALVEQKCTALIRPQLAEPDKIRALEVSHKVEANDRHVATYCMEAGDGDGGFTNVDALCFYDLSGRITDPPVVEDDPSIVEAICHR